MDDLPKDLLIQVLGFLVGSDWYDAHSSESSSAGDNSNKKPGQTVYHATDHKPAPLDRTVSLKIRRVMFSLADLRRMNRYWKEVLIDGPGGSKLWFQVAASLGLDPPPQLYADAAGVIPSHQSVCKLLVAAEEQRETLMAGGRTGFFGKKTACRMRAPRPYPQHPLLGQEEAIFVTLNAELRQRIAENAVALESFLGAVNYCFHIPQSSRTRKRKRPDNDDTGDEQDDDESENEDCEDEEDNAQRQIFHAQSALNRYRLFLQLKQSHPNTWLVPTVDIEFCWLAHIFRTETYWKDMTALGIDPAHSLCLRHYGEVAGFSAAVQGTAALWESTFENLPYLPKDADTSWNTWTVQGGGAKVCRNNARSFFPALGPPVYSLPSTCSVQVGLTAAEIGADLSWFPELKQAFSEMKFEEYHVLRNSGCYTRCDTTKNRDSLMKKHLLPSYERFINLCNQSKMKDDHEVAPPYVLDLIWHAHQLEPVSYKKDCLTLFGCEFWHHPWPNGLGISSAVSKEFECAWKSRYGTAVADDWKLSMS